MVRLETVRLLPENRHHRYFGAGFRAGMTFKATAGPVGLGLTLEGHAGSLSSGTDLENADTVLRDISYDGTAVMFAVMLNHFTSCAGVSAGGSSHRSDSPSSRPASTFTATCRKAVRRPSSITG